MSREIRQPDEPMTPEDFAAKVNWEGGVMDALAYGLKPSDAPEGPIRDLWTQAHALWEQLDPIRYDLGILLDEIYDNAQDGES